MSGDLEYTAQTAAWRAASNRAAELKAACDAREWSRAKRCFDRLETAMVNVEGLRADDGWVMLGSDDDEP